MGKGLTLTEVQEYIKKSEQVFRHEECNTCECFLGYVVQLEIDADDEGKAFLQDYQSGLYPIHSCLGCDPCSPGILYSNYLRKKSSGIG